MEIAVFSLKFCRPRGQMQTLEWLKNYFHFAEICDEVIKHVEFVLTADQYQDTVDALLTDTLIGGQLYLRPPSQNPVSTSIQTWLFDICTRGQFS